MHASPDTLITAINNSPEQDIATTLGNSYLLGFDTETTGTSSRDAIVSAALVLRNPETGFEGDVTAQWLVNPHRHIEAGASKVNGFTDEFVQANGEEPQVAIAQIAQVIAAAQTKRIPLLAYNAPFDVRMIAGDLKRWKLDPLPEELLVVDPLVIDREVSHRSGKRTLSATTEYYGVEPHGDFHDAIADTIAAVDLIAPMARLFPQINTLKLEDLMDWQRQAHGTWRESFNKWLESRGRRPVNDTWL